VKQFPSEFEAMLSAEGREVLAGRHEACGVLLREKFYASASWLDRDACEAATKLLAGVFGKHMLTQGRRLPAANAATKPNEDALPKMGRMGIMPSIGDAAPLAISLATECGLLPMVRSESYLRFCEALSGRKLEGPHTTQLFNYRRGDSAGPHTDHHPEEPRMVDGYTDVHITFCTPGIREQLIVYERDGFFSEQRSIAGNGTITAYRLPVWHYTTPLQADSLDDLRWLVLGSFYDA